MKLPIKKKYFDLIKSGKKNLELRDAHLTLECEETGENMRVEVDNATVETGWKEKYPDVLEDEKTIVFKIFKERSK